MFSSNLGRRGIHFFDISSRLFVDDVEKIFVEIFKIAGKVTMKFARTSKTVIDIIR